ncbi:MAG: cytochrome c oxidase cbb3-type subunit 3 [Porticoccus sp.]
MSTTKDSAKSTTATPLVTYCVLGLLLFIGLLVTLINIDLPIVRISYFYGSAVEALFEHNFNPLPVIANENLSYGRPLFFSLVAAPFAAFFGLNASLMLASYLGTAFFVITAYFFFKRMNRRLGIYQKLIPIELLLLFLNPLMIYQFWSAYPDTMLAGQVLLAYILTERIVHEPDRDPRFAIVALGFVIYAAITTKLFGAILGLAVPIYVLMNIRDFLQVSPYRWSRLIWMTSTFAVLGLLMLLAFLGENPTLDFVTDGSRAYSTGFKELSNGFGFPNMEQVTSTLTAFLVGLVLCVNITLLFLLTRFTRFTKNALPSDPAFKCVYLLGLIPVRHLLLRRTPRNWSPAVFAGIYVLGMVPFGEYLAYNVRYFIPIFPFIVVAIAYGYQRTEPSQLRRGVLIICLIGNGLLTINYNVRQVYNAVDLNLSLEAPDTTTEFWLDNLRMDEHLIVAKQIEQVNQQVPQNGEIYWHADYYGTSSYGVIEKLGFRPDITFHYPSMVIDIPRIKTIYLVRLMHDRGYEPLPASLRDHFEVSYYAHGFDKLTPKILLTEPNPDGYYKFGESINLQAELSERITTNTQRVEFLINDEIIASDKEPPYETQWRANRSGQFELKARAVSSDSISSTPVQLSVGMRMLRRPIATSADDAEEFPNGYIHLPSSKINLTIENDYDSGPQLVGLRFQDIQWPQDQVMKSAYLQFTATESNAGNSKLEIHAELTPNAKSIEKTYDNLSTRTRTSSAVFWQPQPWIQGNRTVNQRSPNLAPILQEVLAQPEWKAGNDILFLISGYGERAADSFDKAEGGQTRPELILEGEPIDSISNPLSNNKSEDKPHPNGKRSPNLLYAQHCALCHGDNGEGNKADYANALFNPDFLAITNDNFIYEAIAEGRPGTPMSAWSIEQGGPFSKIEIKALVKFIRSQDTQEQRPLNQSDQVTIAVKGDPESGQPVYTDQCASCHGSQGEGITAPSLNNSRFLATASDAFLYRSIADGRRNTTMPSFAETLDSTTIQDLVALIRSWERPIQEDAIGKLTSVNVPHLREISQKLINPNGEDPDFSLRNGRFVAAEDVVKAMRAGKRMIIADARPPSDWIKGRAKGAIPTPFYSIKHDAHLIPNDGTWVIAYCACPHASSGQVVDELRQRGFPNTAVLDEGIEYWLDRGYPSQYGNE